MLYEIIDDDPIPQVAESSEVKGLSEKVLFNSSIRRSNFKGKLDNIEFCTVSPRGFVNNRKHGKGALGDAKVFFILSGTPTMIVEAKEFPTEPGALIIVEANESYMIINNCDYSCTYLTFEVNYYFR